MIYTIGKFYFVVTVDDVVSNRTENQSSILV